MLVREQLGSVLRDIRNAKRMTLGDVTAGARISSAHLSELERGRTEPSSEIIRTLADFYNVSQADLYLEVGARMSMSDQFNGVTGTDDLTTLLFGDTATVGFDPAAGEVSLDAMPDINNVIPEAPDHLPDSLAVDAPIDVDSNR